MNHDSQCGTGTLEYPLASAACLRRPRVEWRKKAAARLLLDSSVERRRSLDGRYVRRIRLPAEGFLPSLRDREIQDAVRELGVEAWVVAKGANTYLEILPDEVEGLWILAGAEATVAGHREAARPWRDLA